MNNRPYISIIIPAYNAQGTIRTCIRSVQVQNYSEKAFEIIIVDDGSTDNTVDLLESLSLADNVHIYTHNKNRGLAAARNTGIAHSKGNIIIFLDADMEVTTDFIESHVKLHQNPMVQGVVSDLLPAPEFPNDKYQKYLYRSRRGAKKYPADSPLPFTVFLFNCTSVKKKTLDQVGLFDDQITRYGGEDTEFAYRLWQKYPEGLYYAPHIKVVHHHYRPFNKVLKNVETFGREVVPYLVQKHPEFDKLYSFSFIFPSKSLRGIAKKLIGKLVISDFSRYFLTALYHLLPYPFSNRIIRLRLAAALWCGIYQLKTASLK
ncbi:MAG TPA: glycosyltransferase [Candidatus Marinimicrobia bacterium]|nr:glycosyltransferase [Candidatus Neomarinimicrobiota bacterium]